MKDSSIALLKKFKRHYHKCKKSAAELSNSGGNFGFSLNFESGNLKFKREIPDEEKTTQFVVLMRRFLNPLDSIFYKKIWSILKNEFPETLSEEIIQTIEIWIEQLRTGYIGFSLNGKSVSAEDIYRIISDGEFFQEEESLQSSLKALKIGYLERNLSLSLFYDYSVNGLHVVSGLFDLILKAEKSAQYQSKFQDPPVKNKKCIYCLTENGSFTSEEHIIPESLGNDEYILPKGYVCDTCNNKVLSHLDNQLIQSAPISFLRVLFLAHTKAGKLPTARFQDAVIEKIRPRELKILSQTNTNQMQVTELDDGTFRGSLSLSNCKFSPKDIGRALYKIALGFIAFDYGQDTACHPKFDAARKFITTGTDAPNGLLIQLESIPTPEIAVQYVNLEPKGTAFFINIYGFLSFINIEDAPQMQMHKVLKELNFELISLKE
ncbi:MAG: HNH endonuclease [Gemmatimonadetes bacterium]|nr:HNH endonuclease [Gemmatimonadota bacterium]